MMVDNTPKAVSDCHELLKWLIQPGWSRAEKMSYANPPRASLDSLRMVGFSAVGSMRSRVCIDLPSLVGQAFSQRDQKRDHFEGRAETGAPSVDVRY